ncbi:hypothetical protein B7939_01195 [Eggerthia catenaformis]|nr:hypothetical protein B7939_01195 [Eggerthia catenaformis]
MEKQKKNQRYWEDRKARAMIEAMDKAETTASQIKRLYAKASIYTNNQIEGIFKRYQTKHNLSEREALEYLKKAKTVNVEELTREFRNKNGQARKEILKELESPAFRMRIDRVVEAQKNIDRVMGYVYRQEKLSSTKLYKTLYKDGYNHSIFNIQKRTGIAFNFHQVDDKLIDSKLSENWVGDNYSNRIWNNTQQLASDVKDEMMLGALTGKTERDMVETLTLIYLVGAHNARRLVRTESSHFFNQADMDAYKEAGIKHYRYVATLDLRTSEICAEMDGKIFKVSKAVQGKNYPPMHPWCRSVTIQSDSVEYLKDLERRAYDPISKTRMTVPGDMTYKEWYASLEKSHGELKMSNEKRKIVNYSRDKEQFERYHKILKDSPIRPEKLDKFQETKYNDIEKYKQLRRQYMTINEINQKDWSDDFKEKCKSTYFMFFDKGAEISSHFASRLVDRMDKHNLGMEEALDILKKPFNYIQASDGRLVKYYDKNVYIYNPITTEYVTYIHRNNIKKGWSKK